MKTFAFAATALMLSALDAKADAIGVAACDAFLVKYEACLSKIPAAQRSAHKSQIDKFKQGWAEIGKDSSVKHALEPICKDTDEQLKEPLQAYGCSF